MKLLLYALVLLPAFAQEPQVPLLQGAQDPQPQAQEQQQPAPDATAPQTPRRADRSVLEVKPGGQVIKHKDLWEKTGYFHPFLRMPKYIASDQKHIWLAPFHTSRKDIKWWVIFGAATGTLIATDKWTVKQLPNTNGQVRIGNYTSNVGAAYSLVPISAGFYFLGTAAKSERFRETGLLGFEALIDTTILETVIKAATDRARPLESDGKGHFWDGQGSVWNASFPSGHAINTFALASVVAHQYHNWPVRIVAYGLATTVVGARLAARRHFPADVVTGAAMGWFIGDYVYGKRHNDELDKPTISQRVLDHVHFGFAFQ